MGFRLDITSDSEQSNNKTDKMASESGIFTISKNELEGHDNLAHSISEITIEAEKPSTTVKQLDSKMPSKPQFRFGFKTGVSLDVVITILASIWIALTEFGYVPNYKQGFYCGTDDKIIYKFKGDTVTVAVICISVFFPILIMYLVEILRCDSILKKALKSVKVRMQAILWTREYLVGIVVKLFIVETLKVVVGELRPHFLDTCKPDAAINCTPGEYITEYTCTNTKPSFYQLSDSSRSFPSGHASLAAFEAIFICWYLQKRFPRSSSSLLLPLIQCLCLTWGFVCGATRVVDHRHHYWDVLAGDIIGALLAIVTCTVLCKNFRVRPANPDHINQNGHTSVRRLLSDTSCKEESSIAMAQA